MIWQLTPAAAALIASASVAAMVALFAWRRRSQFAMVYLLGYALAASAYGLAYALELARADLGGKVLSAQLQQLVSAFFVPCAYALALSSGGAQPAGNLPRRTWAWLAIHPSLLWLAILTNPWHHLMWVGFEVEADGPFVNLIARPGPLFFAHLAYLVGAAIVVLYLVVRPVRAAAGRLRELSGGGLIGAAAPMAAIALVYWRLNPLEPVSLVPFALSLAAVAWAWAVTRLPRSTIIRTAREAVIDSLKDAILVVDTRKLLVDANPIARALFQLPAEALGRPLADVLHTYPELARLERQSTDMRLTISVGGRPRHYHLRLSPLADKSGAPLGWLIALRDITRADEAARLQSALYRIAQAAMAATDLPELYQSIHLALGSLLPVSNFYIALYDPEADEISFPYFVDEHESEPPPPGPPGRGLTEYVLRTRQPQIVPPGVFEELCRAGEVEPVGAPSLDWLGVPLTAHDRVRGVLAVQSYTEGVRFGEAELTLLTFVSAQVTAAITRKQAETAQLARGRYLALLSDITQAALKTDDALTMLGTIADRLAELFDAAGCYIARWEGTPRRFTPAAAAGAHRDLFLNYRVNDAELGLADAISRGGQPLIIAGGQTPAPVELPRRLQRLFARWSALLLPLTANEVELGLAILTFDSPRRFQRDELANAQQAARQIALALAKVRALETAERRAHEAETLRRASAAVAATLRPAEAVQRILEQLASVVPFQTASVMLVRDNFLEIVGGRGWADLSTILGIRFDRKQDPLSTDTFRHRAPYIVADIPASPYARHFHPSAPHIRGWMGVPLIVHDEVVGMLTLDSNQPNFFNADHARLAAAFADQVAVAIENARLYDSLQSQAVEMAGLYRASEELFQAGSNVADVGQAIVDAITREFGIAHCGVALIDSAGTRLVRLAQSGDIVFPRSADSFALDGPGLIVAAVQQEESVYAPDVHQDPRYLATHADIRSEYVVPLRIGQQVIGVLNCESPEVDGFDERLRRLLTEFARRAVLAIENARLVDHLDRARRAAQEASQMKSDFLANTSHELRTPLTGILGSLNLVLEGMFESRDEEHQMLRNARQAGQRLLDLINALLDLSKIEAGRYEVNLEAVDVVPIMAEVYTLLHTRALEKQLHFRVDLPPTPVPRLWADPAKVRQILLNLVGNALKFTEQGEVVVWTEMGPVDQMRLVVRDTGIGIATPSQADIFEPFVQGDGSTTRRYGGTGLGLSIARRFTEMMNGTLSYASPGPGLGSTFTLSLPLAAVDQPAGPLPRPAPASRDEPSAGADA